MATARPIPLPAPEIYFKLIKFDANFTFMLQKFPKIAIFQSSPVTNANFPSKSVEGISNYCKLKLINLKIKFKVEEMEKNYFFLLFCVKTERIFFTLRL